MCIPTAAMMFCLCAIIAPAAANGDASANRRQPTDADNYCSLLATGSTATDALRDKFVHRDMHRDML